MVAIIKTICLVSRQHKANTRTTFNILSFWFSWNYMYKRGHIVCIMSILCLEDYLTMPEVNKNFSR